MSTTYRNFVQNMNVVWNIFPGAAFVHEGDRNGSVAPPAPKTQKPRWKPQRGFFFGRKAGKDPMTTGRIESYIHSDKTTPNKGAALVRVTSDTDFAAKTPEFVDFAKNAAKLAFAAQVESWADVVLAFPHVEEERVALEKTLREKIVVDKISLLAL